jgi:PhoPQ-activated pathogenicity-related protein
MLTRSSFLLDALSAASSAMLPSLSALGRERASTLDRYVSSPDPYHRFRLLNTIAGERYTGYVLEMTSLRWRGFTEVDRPVWKHWLTIVEPQLLTTNVGAMIISGGSNGDRPPDQINRWLAFLALTTGSVVSELQMVPNQPLTFADETRPRSEDALVAYSWDKYLKTGDETWPLRLPMTKSVIRAMDTVTAFCRSADGGGIAVDRFVVGGTSKRGWTAWMTAAADHRVAAIVPIVIDLLNLAASFDHEYRAYGFWAPSLREYQEMGIMKWVGTAQMDALMKIEDPYSYRDRLTMPKFIINATGDEFFAPDSSQFYFDGLPDEKYLRYVPNADHSLRGADSGAGEDVLAFYQSVIGDTPRPKFSWRFEDDGSIRVQTATKPLAVKLWQAANPDARDFRLATIGQTFKSAELGDDGGGTYVGNVARPARGWAAYFIEVTYRGTERYTFRFTTGVRVTPDRMPFGPPRPAPTAGFTR